MNDQMRRAGFGDGFQAEEGMGLDEGSPVHADSFGEVRWARVTTLRRQIAAGTYRVPTALLADAVLRAMSAEAAMAAARRRVA